MLKLNQVTKINGIPILGVLAQAGITFICICYSSKYIRKIVVAYNYTQGVDPTKLFFFANEEFFRFSLLSTSRGPHQKVISFSFYLGNDPRADPNELCELTSSKNEYLDGIKLNLEFVQKHYPGYSMRLYHNAPLHTSCPIRKILCNLFCQDHETLDLCNVKKIASYPGLWKSFGMFWRFAPMADTFVDEWHSRDLDAWILQREVDAVKEWKSTNLPKVITLSCFYCTSEKGNNHTFHIMRDHPQHTTDILGGMFGIDQRSLDSKRERLREFNEMLTKYGNKWQKGNDQVVAPAAAKDSMVHDSYLCNSNFIKGSHPAAFPTQRISVSNFSLPETRNFVGNNQFSPSINFECPGECRPKEHKDWKMC